MAKKTEKNNEKQLKLTLVKSINGRLEKQIKTIQALGLTKMNSQVIQKDNDAIRGMIFVVKHLIKVEEV